jgi:hypothetical protein
LEEKRAEVMGNERDDISFRLSLAQTLTFRGIAGIGAAGIAENRRQPQTGGRRMNICYKSLLNKLKRWNLARPKTYPEGISSAAASWGLNCIFIVRFLECVPLEKDFA